MAEVRHNKGEAGGYLVGRRHSNGGIQAVNKSTGQPLEMEGGEVVITRDAVSDSKKRSFNGKMMTNRQILSEINQSGGGVAFADGGEVPDTMHFTTDAEYEYGGKTMCGCDLATEMSKSRTFEEGGDTNNDDLAEKFQMQFDYNGFSQNQYTDSVTDVDISERGLFTILTRIMRDATDIVDTSKIFDLNIRIILSNGTADEIIPIITQSSYADLITRGGFRYDVILADCVEKVQNSAIPNAYRVALAVQQSQKMYFLGISGNIYGTTDETIDADFRQEDFIELDAKTGNNAFSHFLSVKSDSASRQDVYVEQKSNYKDWERGVRALNKETKRETGKPPTTMVVAPSILLASVSDGYFNARMELFISTGKPFVTKWDWWKNNVFSKVNFFVQKYDDDTDRTLNLTFSNVDFTPYEQEIGNVLPITRSQSKTRKSADLAIKTLKDKEGFTWINRNTSKVMAYDNIEVTDIRDYRKFDFYLSIQHPDPSSPPSMRSESPTVRQDKIYFIGKDGIFVWNTKANNRFNDPNFVVVANEAYKKAAAQRKAAAEVARAAELKLAKEAAKAKQKRKEAIKNRPFKVRDQPEDFEFFDYEDLSDDNYKSKSEREALVTMLKIAKGPKNFAIRKVILKKISKIDKQLEEQRMSSAGNDGIDVNKLLTPKGLMDYYFNQTRQSPVKKMNEPCGLPTPTGIPSKLSLQAYNAVRTLYFKRWFGDWEFAAETDDYTDCSKIVDPETKEPRIMYHGVRKYDSRVDVANTGKGIIRPYAEFKAPNFPATYFGSDQSYVEFYAGMAENQPHPDPNYEGFVYYVFLNMRNPIYIDALGISEYSYDDLLAYIAIQYGLIIEPSQAVRALVKDRKDLKPWNYVRRDLNLIAELKKAGFDGIVQVGNVPAFTPEGQVAEQDLIGDEYLIFDANQVKSAVVKNSFYVPMIDDIRFKDGGYVRI